MNGFKPTKPPPAKKPRKKAQKRTYREIIAQNSQNSDWVTSGMSDDADIWQNSFALRARMRDLWKCNPYFAKYRETLAANIFGENGIMLRMKVKETEDRVVNTPDERNFYIEHRRRQDRVRKWAADKARREFCREFDPVRAATIKVGEPDLFANTLIERRWKEWQRAENCDVRGRRDYDILRQIRLWGCARDGDHFIRLVRDPSLRPFGFALQHINSEWCDFFANTVLSNGNEVRMGIEYETRAWGIGRPVAYHFIKRMPKDWQWTVPMGQTAYNPSMYDRIPASEIIHVARYTDTDGTRPAPWGASTIAKSRGLDQFELAEVFAARAAACKTGWLESTLVPEGGALVGTPDPTTAVRNLKLEPGGLYGLPYGVTHKDSDPKHPNQNFAQFRQGMLQSWCAGMPTADYNSIANDLANISFSSGRLGRLDTNEASKMIQAWDIQTSERRIFEAWLEMALITGAIQLPLAKFQKFNKPVFQGRRWRQVDEVKEVTAASLRIANALSSRSREAADTGQDWEEIAFELAEEQMLADQLGLDIKPTTSPPEPNEPDADETETPPKTKPAANGNGDAKPPKKTATSAPDFFNERT